MINQYDKIYALCEDRGISIAKLCSLTGISKSVFTELKSGRTKSLGAKSLSKVAGYFNVSSDYLITEGAEKKRNMIPVFGKVSAGIPIEAITDIEDYEEIPLPQGAPADADFCIDISGDSMEPFIRDGDRVYVKRGAPIKEFEPGIFFVDGDVFCKQFCPGYAGETYLLSANPKRQDANITIHRDSGRDCIYFGKVLLNQKLPKPQYK